METRNVFNDTVSWPLNFTQTEKLWGCVINMAPVAQGRPKASSVGGFVRMYDPVKSRDAKMMIKTIISSQFAPEVLLDGCLFVVIGSYIMPPKLNTKLQFLASEEKLAPLHKPDVDNYFKGIADACKGVVWRDDSLITDMYSFKRYSYKPHVSIDVYRADVEGR